MNNERKPRPWREIGPEEVAAAREMYFRHGPASLSLVVREMREMGWKQFSLSDLCGRPKRPFAGLVAIHGWEEEWRKINEPEPEPESAAAAEAEAEETAAELPTASPPTGPDFPSWLEASEPRFKWRVRFQREIYKQLDRITRGRSRRLMIFMPPRHGKSELVTIRYAAWRLTRDPSLRIVIGSYNQRLANKFSRSIKRAYTTAPLSSPYADEPTLTLNAMDEWETPQGGGVKAVGAGAGITGFGADLIIIDDPVRSRAAAESRNNRERVWEWFTDDLMTRLEPNGAVILIQTRWHTDDLAGRLLRKRRETGDGRREKGDWSVIRLPALAEATGAASIPACNAGSPGTDSEAGNEEETPRRLASKDACAPVDALRRKPGDALWPERFSRDRLHAIREEIGEYSFAALYQQTPIPAEGALFKREWFSRVVPSAPVGLRWCRGYDLAVSTKTSADYTASFRVALDQTSGELYIADGFRARVEFPEQRRYIVDRIREERDTEHGIEQALHGQAFVQELWREERLSSRSFRGVRVTGDKLTRALAWANRAEAGKVVLVYGAWIEAFLDEITHFPHSAHDDQIDAVSLAVQMLETKKNEVWAF